MTFLRFTNKDRREMAAFIGQVHPIRLQTSTGAKSSNANLASPPENNNHRQSVMSATTYQPYPPAQVVMVEQPKKSRAKEYCQSILILVAIAVATRIIVMMIFSIFFGDH